MNNKKYILVCSILSIVLLISFVSAATTAHGAYIYKSKTDKNILNIFSDLRIKVDLIKESTLPVDLSKYKFIFIGDENLAGNIEIDKYPIVIMNHYIPEKDGLTNEISRLVSTMPLQANFNGNKITVYNSAKDSRGVALPYYYLDKQNKATSLSQFLGTYTTSSGENFGDVISVGKKGDKLLNGNVLEENICFFGITRTEYWTPQSETLFKDCLKYVFDYTNIQGPVINCTIDSDCGTDGLIGSTFCSSNKLSKNYISYKCNLAGTEESYCTSKTTEQLVQTCTLGCSNGKCNIAVCNSNNDCNDNNSSTEDTCTNPGAVNSVCIHNIIINPECSTNIQCDDKNSITEDICISPGKINSVCIHNIIPNPIECTTNLQCDDKNSTTIDSCVNAGTKESICIHNIYNTINNTYIKLLSFVATPNLNSVTLNFSAISENNNIKGYLLSLDKQKWILVSYPASGYVFGGLSSGTNYVFYAKALDSKNIPSDEMNMSVTTLSPATDNGGSNIVISSGGGVSNGQVSYCSAKWECSSWSECSNSVQTRTCFVPAGKCTPEVNKPSQSQSCIETPATTIESTSPSNTTSNSESNPTNPNSNALTGAAIADALGKYSLPGIIGVLAIGGAAYYLFRKPKKKVA